MTTAILPASCNGAMTTPVAWHDMFSHRSALVRFA